MLVFKLKASLIHNCLVDDRCFSQVDLIFCVLRIVSTRRQIKSANALDVCIVGKAVTSNQGVVGVDLVIDTRTERGAATWDRNDVTEIRNIIAAIKYQRRYN